MRNDFISVIQSNGGIDKLETNYRQFTEDEVVGSRVFLFDRAGGERIGELEKRLIKNGYEVVILDNGEDFKDLVIPDSRIVIYIGDGVICSSGDAMKMKNAVQAKLGAGLIAPYGLDLCLGYKVDNLYNPIIRTEPPIEQEFTEVDEIAPYFFGTRASILKQLSIEKINGLIGLDLRRLGYQNYIKTDIQVSQEGEL